VSHVEASEQLGRSVAARRTLVKRPEEELVEFAVEQRRIGERIPQDEAVAPNSRLGRDPAESGAESGKAASGEERSEAPAWFGVRC